jgi:hypothetical protein
MSTRNLPGGKGWPASKADDLTAICETIVERKCRSLDVSQSYEPPQPVTWTALLFLREEFQSFKVLNTWNCMLLPQNKEHVSENGKITVLMLILIPDISLK